MQQLAQYLLRFLSFNTYLSDAFESNFQRSDESEEFFKGIIDKQMKHKNETACNVTKQTVTLQFVWQLKKQQQKNSSTNI